MMGTMTLLSLSALLALLPSALLPYRGSGQRDGVFWSLLAVSFAGPLTLVIFSFAPGWQTGLAPALWITVTATIGAFFLVAVTVRDGWRLAALLYPYLIILGIIATIWQGQSGEPMTGEAPSQWIFLHIGFSLATYAVLTLAAVAGVCAFLQERALKAKKETGLTRTLPTLSSSETLELRLLSLTAVILLLGLLTGMTVQYFESGVLLIVNHKTLFSFATLSIVAILLIARRTSGLRGRKAARLVLLAYLLLTIAYPGVKFVTDVLIT
jgi:ABC-type uncharacterized transport system permease subunit